MPGPENLCFLNNFDKHPCCFSNHYKSNRIFTRLSQCNKDIEPHLRSIHSFESSASETLTEAGLILSRVGLFVNPELVGHFNVCQSHRDAYGIYWKKTSHKCKHPLHGTSKCKADRGTTYTKALEIQVIWRELVFVGDGKIDEYVNI